MSAAETTILLPLTATGKVVGPGSTPTPGVELVALLALVGGAALAMRRRRA